MGLLAGISVISIIEIFYHLVRHFSVKHNKVDSLVAENDAAQATFRNKDHALYQLSKYFVKYIKSSDLHGVHYTNDRSQGRCGRTFWTILIILSITTFSFLVNDMYKHAEKSPIMVRIDPQMMTLDEVRRFIFYLLRMKQFFFQIPFPSLVICADIDLDKYLIDKRCFYEEICENVSSSEVYAMLESLSIDTELIRFDFRWQALYVGGYYCDNSILYDIATNFNLDIRTKGEMMLREKFKRYSRLEWLHEQNFCYEQQAYSTLSSILTFDGLCYIFNNEMDMFDSST